MKVSDFEKFELIFETRKDLTAKERENYDLILFSIIDQRTKWLKEKKYCSDIERLFRSRRKKSFKKWQNWEEIFLIENNEFSAKEKAIILNRTYDSIRKKKQKIRKEKSLEKLQKIEIENTIENTILRERAEKFLEKVLRKLRKYNIQKVRLREYKRKIVFSYKIRMKEIDRNYNIQILENMNHNTNLYSQHLLAFRNFLQEAFYI